MRTGFRSPEYAPLPLSALDLTGVLGVAKTLFTPSLGGGRMKDYLTLLSDMYLYVILPSSPLRRSELTRYG